MILLKILREQLKLLVIQRYDMKQWLYLCKNFYVCNLQFVQLVFCRRGWMSQVWLCEIVNGRQKKIGMLGFVYFVCDRNVEKVFCMCMFVIQVMKNDLFILLIFVCNLFCLGFVLLDCVLYLDWCLRVGRGLYQFDLEWWSSIEQF